MEPLTLALAALGALLIWFTAPARGLVVYLALIIWYPQYLTVPVAGVDFNLTRILVVVLLLRTATRPHLLRDFRLTWLDVLVVAALAGRWVALATNEPFAKTFIREGGTLFDTVLPYLVARFVVRAREDIYVVIKGLVVIAIPMAIVGMYESVTGHNPYSYLHGYSAWGSGDERLHVRKGFYRARGSFGNMIPFGLFFAAVLPLVIALWPSGRLSKGQIIAGAAIVLFGAMSSMSSAPLFALVTCCAFLAFYPARRYWPYLLFAVVAFLLAVELYSNRHFYHVLTRFAYSSSTAYYRIELVEEALGGGMNGHWLFGYGYVGVGSDTVRPDFNWVHQDLVNIYIAHLARTGLVGLIPFVLLNIEYYRRLYVAGRYAPTVPDKWLVWCVAAALLSWNLAMMTVGALSQTQTLLHVLFAFCGSLGFAWLKDEPERALERRTFANPRVTTRLQGRAP